MIFFTHVAFALLLVVGLQKFLPLIDWPFLFVALLFSTFPDIDIGTSFIGKHFRIINFFMRHRGITHTIVFMMACVIAVFAISQDKMLAWATFLGYSSHLALDCLTPAGLHLFWPANIKTSGPFKSGGVIDMVMFAGFVTLTVLVVAYWK